MIEQDEMKVTLECYGKKRSITIPDDSTWWELLDEVLALITSHGMYIIDSEKLIKWANTTEAVND